MYPAFFTKKPVRSDRSFFVPKGFLRYDKRKDRYVVTNDAKFRNPMLPGTLTQMSRGGCDMDQQGAASFPLASNHLLSQKYIGDVSTTSGQMVLRGGMVVDMPMPGPILEYLASFIGTSDRSSGAGHEVGNYEYMLNELVGVDVADEMVSLLDRNITGSGFKKDVPKEVRHTFIFHGMEWRFDTYDDMWVSEGEVSIATLGKHDVWRSVQGKVAVDRAKDRLIVYLHFGRKHWYFFEWKAKVGIMSVASREVVEEGEPTLSSLITEMKDSEKRIVKGKKKFILQQLPLTDKTKQRFVEAYREFDE